MNKYIIILLLLLIIFTPLLTIYTFLLNGFIHRLNYNNTIIINFDDSSHGQYVNAYPVLKEYNYVATYAIITGYSHISSNELIELKNYGMDIESHTVNHINLNLEMNPYIIIYELNKSKSYLSNLGIDSNILILPFGVGAYNIIYRCIVDKYYNYSRGTLYNITSNQNFYNLNNGFNRYNIPSLAIGNYTSINEFKNLINNMGNKLVILTYHRVENKSDSYLTISTAKFKEEIEYLKEMHFKTITLKQYLRGIK